MGLLAPSSLLFGLLAIPIVALYLLRLRGRERVVSSTFLWRRIVHDLEANTPWQRLRANLLLILQLVALAALVLALAGPYLLRASSISGDLIVLLDSSASMRATDVGPSRFEKSRQEALRLMDHLPPDSLATVILMGDVPEVLVAQSLDRETVRRAIVKAQPSVGGANLASALSLAASVVQGDTPALTVVLSDGNVTGLQPTGVLPFELRYEPIGAPAGNLAIAAFSIRRTETGVEGLARITNYGRQSSATSLHLYTDGTLYDVREMDVGGDGDHTVRWFSLPEATILEARLVPGDTFSLDDRAWATGDTGAKIRALLVSRGNRFLEKALSLQPGLEVTRATPDTYSTEGDHDLWVFDGFKPATLPDGAVLVLDPPAGSAPWVSAEPVHIQATRPSGSEILRYVDLSNVHVREAVPLRPLPEARVLLDSDQGPLFAVWEEPHRRVAVFAFDLHDSDLPLQPAFPILIQNLTHWLLPAANRSLAVQPGAAIAVPILTEADAAWVEMPSGLRTQVAPPFPAPPLTAEEVGLYRIINETPEGMKTGYLVANLFAPIESAIGPSVLPPLETQQGREEGTDRVPWELAPWLALIAVIVMGAEWYVYSRGY